MEKQVAAWPVNQRIPTIYRYIAPWCWSPWHERDHKRVQKNSRTNKKQPQEYHDLWSTYNRQYKKLGVKLKNVENDQIKMEKAGERKNRKANRRKNKAGIEK